MSPAKERPENPDLIVGIDFGLTGTGVAWALPSVDKVESIKTWPVYSLFKKHIGRGDESAGDDASGGNRQDEDNLDSPADPDKIVDEEFESDDDTMSFHKAKECLTQYLAGLHAYIKKRLSSRLPNGTEWRSMNAWFLFSYPTTWGPAAIERFSNIVNSSSFGSEEGHWVDASYMNEAQASMTSFATEGSRPAPGKVVIIADIGGGTTDVNIYHVDEDDGKKVMLKGEIKASGQDYGSVDIDARVTIRLRDQVRHTLFEGSSAFKSMTLAEQKRVAQEQTLTILRRHGYVATKHGVDKESPADLEERYPLSLTSSAAPVATLKFKMYGALKSEFRKECKSIWDQIEAHLKNHAVESVDRLVLTGGMANNALVQNWFEEKVSKAKDIGEITFLREPELAISKGLVHGALESYKRDDIWVYKVLHSYGVVVYKSGTQVEAKQKLLEKGKIVSLEKFKKKQTIRFKSGNKANTALWLVRWDNDRDANGITKVGCLTTGWPTPIEWESSKSLGSDAKAEVELSFERRTAIVAFWSKGKQEHRRVFNEEWHSGADQTPPRRLPSFMNLTKIGLGIAGLITFIINAALGDDVLDEGDGGTGKPQNDGKGGPKKHNVEEQGDQGAEEGVGQFDNFEEA